MSETTEDTSTAETVEPTRAALELDLAAAVRARDFIRADRDAQASMANDLRHQLEQLKASVVDVAMDVADEQGWCDQGLREALARLGLEPRPRTYSGTVTVTIQVTGLEPSNGRDAEDTFRYGFDGVEVSGIEYGNLEAWVDAIDLDRDDA